MGPRASEPWVLGFSWYKPSAPSIRALSLAERPAFGVEAGHTVTCTKEVIV